VRQTNLLQKVIPLSLNTRFDLPVINKKGELKGRLESSKLADVLSP
jgi:glycine betaine/proline transport system ATP-binding protein